MLKEQLHALATCMTVNTQIGFLFTGRSLLEEKGPRKKFEIPFIEIVVMCLRNNLCVQK